MRILQVPFTYYPDAAGGTEVYVDALTRHLQTEGIEGVIAAPGEAARTYCHEGVPVHRFETSPTAGPRDVYGAGDEQAADQFASILSDLHPDLVHLHAHTRGVSLRLVEAAEARGIPVLYTYHTPTGSCPRGTLLRRGKTVCDGKLDVHRCAGCVLQKHGLPEALSTMVGSLPPGVGRVAGKAGRAGGGWTALRMSELVKLRHQTVRAFWEAVDHIVAVCEWVQQVLRRNDVPGEKITVSRQGLPLSERERPTTDEQLPLPDAFDAERPLRLAFFGRLHPTKGVHVFLRALQQMPKAPVALDVYGVAQHTTEYVDDIKTLVEEDHRVSLRDPIAAETVPATMQGYDAVTVPSQWLETGPLVVYEAFAAGRPVIGSDLGGIAELVTDGVDGALVESGNEAAWSQTIRQLIEAPSLLRELHSGIRPPRTMEDAAMDMVQLYQRVLSNQAFPT